MTETAGDPAAAAGPYKPGWEGLPSVTRVWFPDALSTSPTPMQERVQATIGWGGNVLIIAPTGPDKTFASFLSAIDRLGRESAAEGQGAEAVGGGAQVKVDGMRVLYIPPLEVLGMDVKRNLRRPLAGVRVIGPIRSISVGVRSGDTPARECRQLRNHPPSILVTTPESLYLMLISTVRETLRTVETIIVDEIHSFTGSKRSMHLAMSLECLDGPLGRLAQRIGLSATISPPEGVARFLDESHPVAIISDDGRVTPEVTVSVPVENMARIPAISDRHTRMERALTALMSTDGGCGPWPSGIGWVGSSQAWRFDRALGRAIAAGQTDRPGAGVPAWVSASTWPYLENAIPNQVLAHRTALVFVNFRGACEQLTAHLNETYVARLGVVAPAPQAPVHRESQEMGTGSHIELLATDAPMFAKTHRESVPKEQRLNVERELTAGELRCVVAAASLKLGIDTGSIDPAFQVVPPPSVTAGLQRVGRADHQAGGRPCGVIYPVKRTHLVGAAIAAGGMRAGVIEHTELVSNALDVLAQQMAAVASVTGGLTAKAWFTTVRRAAPCASLPRSVFDSALELLAGGLTLADLANFSPRIMWNRVAGELSARPSTQWLTVVSSGTIPDRGMLSVVLPEGAQGVRRRRVEELSGEMVHEFGPGDIITLGTSNWRIRQIMGDRVVVDSAEERSTRLLFWEGEGLGRPATTRLAKGVPLHEAQSSLSSEAGAGESEGERALRQ